MRRALAALLLLLPACSSGAAAPAGQAAPVEPSPSPSLAWRSSAAQAASFLRREPVRDETCRQVLRLSAGGEQVRLRLSNVLSPTPLTVTAATVGLRAQGAAAQPASLQPLTVGGASSFVVPSREQVTTDPVPLRVAAGADLLVSVAVGGTSRLTGHEFAARTGWCSGAGTGDLTAEQGAAPFVRGDRAAYVVEDAAVAVPAAAPSTVVVAGDSLTDAPMPPDVHPRWYEVLSARLPGVPVASAAIAGNRVLLEGGFGEPLVQRFERDVLQRDGVGTVVLLAGTNDLAADLGAEALQVELTRLVEAARARQLRVVLATIPPASDRTRSQRAARRAVNQWMRTLAPADLVVDADALLRDERDPERLEAAYDSGDGLHLSPAGHRVLGAAVADALR